MNLFSVEEDDNGDRPDGDGEDIGMKRGGDTGGAEEEPIRRDFPIVPSITGL